MTQETPAGTADPDPGGLSPEGSRIAAALVADSTLLTDETACLLPCELQQDLELPPLRQSHRLEGDRIHSLTYVLFPRVEATTLSAAIADRPWSWWRHGKVSDWKKREDGGTIFLLSPVHPMVPSKVGIELEPPVSDRITTRWGATVPRVRYEARFFADFDGPGRYEILSLSDGCALRSIWDGVRRLGMKKLMPLSMILNMHLGAEAGTVRFPPFSKGTGFPGLMAELAGER